jgi:hypothetical protein
MRGVDVFGSLDAAADERPAGAIEHHETGAGTIGTFLETGHERLRYWRMVSGERRAKAKQAASSGAF